MTEHAVVIAGGGPTGLMLAGELALAGVDVAIVERRPNQDVIGSRAGGLHARTLEVLDQRGIVDRFVSQGQKHPAAGFNQVPLPLSDAPSRHNYVLALWQNHIERILAEWVGELPVRMYREQEVTGFTQDDTGVDVLRSDGSSLRAQYLVGCDGGRSVIRKTAGIEFAGWDATISWLIAEFGWSEEPQWGIRQNAVGNYGIGKVEDPRRARLVLTELPVADAGEPTLDDVREVLIAAYGKDFGIHGPTWISRFTDMARQAVAYRDRRVLLAGDAAHVHAPIGGQGLNTGVQDAVNLGWKLAQVIKRISPAALLDSYHTERHPVAARVLRNTMAMVALGRTDDRTQALKDYVSAFLSAEEPRRRLAAELTGLDIHYGFGAGHPLLGRRMPDLDLATSNGPRRAFSFLHEARAVLFNFGEPGAFDLTSWADRVQMVDATYDGAWELPAIGTVAAPNAVLVRPDGHVAWVDATPTGLDDALTQWFGRRSG